MEPVIAGRIPVADVHGAAREVASICRAIGAGEEPIDFAFCHAVMNASRHPPWMLLAVAARMIVGLAATDRDFTLQQYLDQMSTPPEEAAHG